MNTPFKTIAVVLTLAIGWPAYAQDNTQKISHDKAKEEQAYSIGVQAAIWGRPLVEYVNTNYHGLKASAVYISYWRKFDNVKTAADRYVVTPNNVTIDGYGNAWLADDPVVINVPALQKPRWYIIQIGNMFDEVVYNIGGYKGPETGLFLVTGPDYTGTVPNGMKQIKVNTNLAVVALRVFVSNEKDLAEAREVQKGFHMMPLSVFQKNGLKYTIPKTTDADISKFEFKPQAPENIRFFEQLGFGMQTFLSKNEDFSNPLFTLFHQIGLSAGKGFEWQNLDEGTKRGLARAAVAANQIIEDAYENTAISVNGWRYTNGAGRAGYDFALRATLAKHILGANVPEQLFYPNSKVDADGNAYSGENKYVLHFDKNQIPPVSVFWNLAMYDETNLFIENDFKRYTIGSTTDGLKTNKDGSIDIYIQNANPGKDKESNWLPAPKGTFNLTMRLYGSESAILDGSYRLPAVKKVK